MRFVYRWDEQVREMLAGELNAATATHLALTRASFECTTATLYHFLMVIWVTSEAIVVD